MLENIKIEKGSKTNATPVTMGDVRNKLDDFQIKEDGTAVEFTGQRRLDFIAEMKMKTLANGVVTFLKGFPGFAEWWFTQDNERRDTIFYEIQVNMLGDIWGNVVGTSSDKAKMMRDNIIRYFDVQPGFKAWKEVVLGSTLRERIHHQLEHYLYSELKKKR